MFDKLKAIFTKKEEPKFFDLGVTDLKKGYIFDYNLKSWEVLEEYDYDWGDNFYSKEYKVSSGSETYFLNVLDGDSLVLAMYKKANINAIDDSFTRTIIQNDEPQDRLVFENETYYLMEESQGHYQETGSDDWAEFVSWDFVNKEETKTISVSRWSEKNVEAYTGFYIKEFEINNILGR